MSETNAPAPKKKGGFVKLLAIVLLACAGGGAGAYFYFVKAAPAHAKEAEPELVADRLDLLQVAPAFGAAFVEVAERGARQLEL